MEFISAAYISIPTNKEAKFQSALFFLPPLSESTTLNCYAGIDSCGTDYLGIGMRKTSRSSSTFATGPVPKVAASRQAQTVYNTGPPEQN